MVTIAFELSAFGFVIVTRDAEQKIGRLYLYESSAFITLSLSIGIELPIPR
jgi:hypothetical protein